MLQPAYTRQFQKDLKKMKKRGKDIDKIKTVIKKLTDQTSLEDRYRDHKLVGIMVEENAMLNLIGYLFIN